MVIDLTHSDDQSEKPVSLKGSEPSPFSSEALPTSTLAIISASISSLLSESARSSASALVSGPSLASNSALPISGSTPSSILTSVQENTQENAHTP
ncbi:hypothetical protein BGX29_001625, partial [Mortierella sp. GBA35]